MTGGSLNAGMIKVFIMNTSRTLNGLVFFLLFASGLHAQAVWNWGENEALAKEKNTVYTDELKKKNYEGALAPLEWLLTNTPDLNKSIYINSGKIYGALVKNEKEPAKREEYIQRGLELFDKRMELYGEKENVMERKALFAYQAYNKNEEKYKLVFDLYEEAFRLKGKKMNRGNLVAYMNMLYKCKRAGEEFTDEEILNIYSAITEALEAQKEASDEAKAKKIAGSIETVDKLFVGTKIKIDCAFIENRLGPQLEETGDINLAKKIFHLALKGKCTDSPVVLKAAKIIHESTPTYAIAEVSRPKACAVKGS